MIFDLLIIQRKLLQEAKIIFDVGAQNGETSIGYAEVMFSSSFATSTSGLYFYYAYRRSFTDIEILLKMNNMVFDKSRVCS